MSQKTPLPISQATNTKAPPRRQLLETTDLLAEEITDGEVKEIGGPSGPEPTRYGDWEKNGRCSDF